MVILKSLTESNLIEILQLLRSLRMTKRRVHFFAQGRKPVNHVKPV